MPWALTSNRRYYLRAAVGQAEEMEPDLAGDIVGLRKNLSVSPLPPLLPFKKKLTEAVSAELLEEANLKVYLYEGLEDLIGCDEEELEEAGLDEEEADQVLTFLEKL